MVRSSRERHGDPGHRSPRRTGGPDPGGDRLHRRSRRRDRRGRRGQARHGAHGRQALLPLVHRRHAPRGPAALDHGHRGARGLQAAGRGRQGHRGLRREARPGDAVLRVAAGGQQRAVDLPHHGPTDPGGRRRHLAGAARPRPRLPRPRRGRDAAADQRRGGARRHHRRRRHHPRHRPAGDPGRHRQDPGPGRPGGGVGAVPRPGPRHRPRGVRRPGPHRRREGVRRGARAPGRVARGGGGDQGGRRRHRRRGRPRHPPARAQCSARSVP